MVVDQVYNNEKYGEWRWARVAFLFREKIQCIIDERDVSPRALSIRRIFLLQITVTIMSRVHERTDVG